MAQTGNTTWSLPVKTTINDDDDRLLILYGASTANTPSSVAQTGTISIKNLYANAKASIAANNLSTNGTVTLANLPIEDPLVNNAIWSNNGVLTISVGSA